MSGRSPAWHRDEVILALNLYVARGCLAGGPLPGREDPEVVALSERMNDLPIWNLAQRRDTFLNPAGVALKLANLRAVERVVARELGRPHAEHLPRGMGSFSVLDRVVFEEFEARWEALRVEAAAVDASVALAPRFASESPGRYQVDDAPVEGGGVIEYEASTASGGRRSRLEAELVTRYSAHMEDLGHQVTGRHYKPADESRPLRADLLVRDLNVLVEAKASDARHSLRMAVGQLLDYRRYEETKPDLAVLLPRRPVGDLLTFLDELSIGCVWASRDGFADTVDGRLAA